MSKVTLGLNKKSFAMYYNGGSIWFEHLDSLCHEKELVMKKFKEDLEEIKKPSTSSFVAVILDETEVDKELLSYILDSFGQLEKRLQRVVFVGLNFKWKWYIRKRKDVPFILGCVNDLEAAKAWLV